MGVLPICHLVLQAQKPKPERYPASPKTLGEHLRQRRMDLGLFQHHVATQLGADVASVWLWENGRGQAELKWIPSILKFLGYDTRPIPQTIAVRLVRFRETRGWSQKRLAMEPQVDPTTLSRWELMKKLPWEPYLARVTALLNGQATNPATFRER